jgi:hypothetical protein
MGDDWRHRIIVEKFMPAEPKTLYPQFLGGERRCPPEDCGGFPGYYNFLDNIATNGAITQGCPGLVWRSLRSR